MITVTCDIAREKLPIDIERKKNFSFGIFADDLIVIPR